MPPMTLRPIDSTSDAPRLFKEPLISVTFDDGWETIYTDALPLLNKYGIRTTQYIIAGALDDHQYMSVDQIKAMLRDGHEIGSHTVTHPDVSKLAAPQLGDELLNSKNELERIFGVPVIDFATPYGAYDDRSLDFIRRVYRSHRNVVGEPADGIDEWDVNVIGPFNRYNIIGVTVRRDTTVQELQKLIDYTIANNGWLVLNYHDIDDGPSVYGLDTVALERQLKYLHDTQIRIPTVGQVLDTLTSPDPAKRVITK
ncbi:polysaccharide deacetylase family protein [Candidatus Saccharibacteria bacterium]|nr:polysaccharide deacetylase family protein [Candidatus Saccharibacteria bacterium]